MKIGEISKHSSVAVETIRYYEKIGLLPKPDRDASGYRAYRNAHLERLLFIKRCRNLDMAQDEIRELIRLSENPEADCHQVDTLLDNHLNHVRNRLKELLNLEKTLQQLQKACSDAGRVQDCGILGGLSSELRVPHPEHSDHRDDHENHVPGTHGPGKH
ncbi:Cd(II)/Pb(II)-responsive transcriptional regulator [Marinobacter sp. S6332]|uniref:Cd(II)/Pb(II)-responsive transcriptional regulator n=1 Tax=Marinobacter sp. S6332 TaxID=2926403 RepID=UPI001FF46DBF|nr:Cd(II)/Pb(II)-responsive transcriptional regulator [Marinobacter sp. S6332]MCK0163097.1 Cd(II)/Pb(II)-responsive transcriptional regulator [Marinobacter sp. S6332]